MTPATMDYLLRIAIDDRDKLALEMVQSDTLHSDLWGEAAAAVKELLEYRQRAAEGPQRR